MMTIFQEIFSNLVNNGGVIVTTNDLVHDEVENARHEGRLYVDENGFGFVWFESCEAAVAARPEPGFCEYCHLVGELEDIETNWSVEGSASFEAKNRAREENQERLDHVFMCEHQNEEMGE